ncbi:MAG: exo-alpha-sialidase [Ruminococcaceae bacterium]|nr:exo-alpha-sialidase [Oscillospiraceae bacterium]
MRYAKTVALLLSLLTLASCASTPPTETTADNVTEGSDPVTEPVKLPEPKLTSIYELNPKHEEGSHTDMTSTSFLEADYRSRNEISEDIAKATVPYYTRLKQLPDGSYILLYNDEHNGKGVRMLRSEDGVNWGEYSTVFAQYSDKVYANPDALVLQNGDILCCAAWRHTGSYYRNPSKGGISIKRSTDNGKTWGKEQVIFIGINWEPYMLQLRSGEIQIYWTNTTCYVLPSCNNTSTGTAILRSYDNGYTWTGDLSKVYSGQVVAKQATELIDGVQFYTDQMPVAVELQNGTIALALESRLNRNNTYRITMAYSSDNWAESIPLDGEGPADKLTNHFVGTAPYIAQFPSGEVILRYSRLNTSTLHLADPTGHNFTTKTVKLDNMKYWGCIELVDNKHTAVVCSTTRYNEGKENELFRLTTQKVNLNHTLFIKDVDITVDGNSAEWGTDHDALFVGSESQAQMSVRFARSEKGLGILIDRLDYDLTSKDSSTVRIAMPQNKLSYIEVTVNPDGSYTAKKLVDGIHTDIAVECAVTVFGTVDNGDDTDEGYLAEILIPAEHLPEELAVYAMLYNKDTKGAGAYDSPDMMNENNNVEWIKLK